MLDNIKLIVLLAFILAAAVIAAAIGCNNIVSGFVIPGIGNWIFYGLITGHFYEMLPPNFLFIN
jgi:hypothetical protein